MKPIEPIIYRGFPDIGYIVTSTHYKMKGAGYVHRLVAQAQNQVEWSYHIPAVELETWGSIGKDGVFLSGTEPPVFPNADKDTAEVGFQGGSRDSEMTFDMRRIMEVERDKLIESGETRESSALLDYYFKKLGDQYFGREQAFDGVSYSTDEEGKHEPKNDPESARKRVEDAIGYFIEQLIETDENRHLGFHFLDAVDTGLDCEYVGDWPFKLF